jgi:hypothetical protein
MHIYSLFTRSLVLILLACGLFGIAAAQIGGDTGYFDITSNPTGASVTFDGSYRGTTPVTVPVPVTGNPSHTIELTKSGYQPWTDTYQGNPGAGETITINADLIFIPVTQQTTQVGAGKGYYQISSSPSGGNVYFDGAYRGTAPVTVEVSSSGTPGHTIMVTLSGYQSWSQNYPGNPADGQTVYVTAYLTPIATYGSISVSSNPSQATAVLDGGQSLLTPATFNNVLPGTHTIMVSKSGYSTTSRTVSVSAGSNTPVSVTLSQQPPNTGSIYMVTTPQGAAAYVDGTYYGMTPALAPGLSAGTHQVRLSLSGFQDYLGIVTVVGGQTTTVTQTLVVAPTGTPTPTQSPATGSIAVSSVPGGASVFLDNAYVGISPLTIPSVQPGSHVVTITQTGYQNYEMTVTVQGGQTAQVSATLTPVTSPTPTQGSLSAIVAVLGLLAVVVLAKRK